jgi:hypothetical protein
MRLPRQAPIWRFDAVVAFAFVALVFLIAADDAWNGANSCAAPSP